jgi:hypothetical protein
MKNIIFSNLLFFAILALAVSPAHAISKDDRRTLAISASGTVKAPADIAHISTGVVSEAKTARAALDANTAAMARVVGELKSQGIEPKDIQTSNFAVFPRYQKNKDGVTQPIIIGYRVTNSVTITVRDLKGLGGILDSVVTLGSNKIGGIRFAIDDPTKLRDEARKRATANALRKAKLYAEAAGVGLGEILSINENVMSRPPRPMMARMAMEAKSASVPIESGELSIEVQVNIVWQIE